MNSYTDLANLVFKDNKLSIQEIENKYKPRNLPANALVTRIAPSPTGFLHLGGVYAALISQRLASQSNGVFFLRIEDTDKKREVQGSIPIIVNSLKYYGINFNEGLNEDGLEFGNYGPYIQSARSEIYKAYVKDLVSKNLAYLSFETEEELEEIIKIQSLSKETLGYYGKWASWSFKSVNEQIELVNNNKPFVVRIRSTGNLLKYIKVNDLFKGNLSLPENNQDIVILKNNGLPTYHFAHLIDDHLMGTTHVLRGDEWLSSLTLHLQLFNLLGWEPPQYGHISPIQKLDGGSRRKLSKRKDPEANIEFFIKEGYPKESVISYLLNLANSGFEEWRKQNVTADLNEYKLNIDQLKKGAGSLFDIVKLNDISKDFLANLNALEVYNRALEWSSLYDSQLHILLNKYKDYSISVFNIERGGLNPRKDLIKLSDIKFVFAYFFDELFENKKEDINLIINYKDVLPNLISIISKEFSELDTKEEWLLKFRNIAEGLGFTSNNKAYKENPINFKGNFADFAMILRVLLTGRTQCPDLYQTLIVLGKDRIISRLNRLN